MLGGTVGDVRQPRRLVQVLAVVAVVFAMPACGSAPTRPERGSPAVAHPSATAAASQSAAGTGRSGGGRLGESPAPRPSTGVSAGPGTAAARYGWDDLVARDDFSGSELHPSWGAYDSAGNSGEGVRSPRQISLRNGVLRMTGTPDGTTAGMAWRHPQKYGRWETRARFPAGCGCYHPVLILWPADDPWPAGGEIDYAEVFDGPRQELNFFLHYGADNRQLHATRQVDMTRWHNFAVEWTPDHVTGYLDGEPYFHTNRRDVLPPGRMNQTIQLDWFPGPTAGGASLEVDWVAMYRL